MTDFLQLFEDGTAQMRLPPAQPASFDYRTLADGKPQITYDAAQQTFSLPYRLLSATILHQHGLFGRIFTDYTAPGVLEAAVPLAQGVTIVRDHDMSAENWIGKVLTTTWATAHNGIDLPGIEGVCQFANGGTVGDEADADRAWVLKGIRDGYLQGMSLNLWTQWRRSHPELDLQDFLRRMGETINGEVVRFIVDKIHRIYEASVCVAGVDQHASPKRADLASEQATPGLMIAHLSATGGWQLAAPREQVVVPKEQPTMADMREAKPPVAAAESPQGVSSAQLDAAMRDLAAKYEPRLAEMQQTLAAMTGKLTETTGQLTATQAELTQAQAALKIEQDKRQTAELLQQEQALSLFYEQHKAQGLPASFDKQNVPSKGEVSMVSFLMSQREPWQVEFMKLHLADVTQKCAVPLGVLGKGATKPTPDSPMQQFKAFLAENKYESHQMSEATRAFRKKFPELAEQL